MSDERIRELEKKMREKELEIQNEMNKMKNAEEKEQEEIERKKKEVEQAENERKRREIESIVGEKEKMEALEKRKSGARSPILSTGSDIGDKTRTKSASELRREARKNKTSEIDNAKINLDLGSPRSSSKKKTDEKI